MFVGTAVANLRPEQAALARAMIAANPRTVLVALRTPWDISVVPEARTYVCSYGVLPPTIEALAAALFGEIPFPRPAAGRDRGHVRARPRSNLTHMALRDEILEQPAAAARLLAAAEGSFAPVRAMLERKRPRFAVIAARGSSDNAALYAQYLFGIRNGLAVALATPSAITLYGARPDYSDALVIAISQSGRSPDIVAVVEEARRQGAPTVVLTNDTTSPLADVAEHAISIEAGPELRHSRDEDVHDGAAWRGTAVGCARSA